jgi:hypothetical protein
MSKPDETPPVKPDSTPRLFGKWILPDNCVVVTPKPGEKFALVGPPMRRIEPTKE